MASPATADAAEPSLAADDWALAVRWSSRVKRPRDIAVYVPTPTSSSTSAPNVARRAATDDASDDASVGVPSAATERGGAAPTAKPFKSGRSGVGSGAKAGSGGAPSRTAGTAAAAERVPRAASPALRPASTAAAGGGARAPFVASRDSPSAAGSWSTVDSVYQSAVTRGRDAVFSRVSRDDDSGVLAFLGPASGAMGARGREPLLHAAISEATRRVLFPARAVTVLADCLAQTVAAAAGPRLVRHAWIPLVLSAGGTRHSNALLVDVAARRVYLFEPHGSDPADAGHLGTAFHRFYDAEQYFTSVSTLVAAANAGADAAEGGGGDIHWTFVDPREYLPACFGQSVTALPPALMAGGCPVAKGDPWCALWTLRFLLEATVVGVRPWAEGVAALSPDALGARVLSWVHASYV